MKQIAYVVDSFSTAADGVEYFSFHSKSSVQHADIALFGAPTVNFEFDEVESPNPYLDEYDSEQYLRHARHWLDEFSLLLSKGKTIFCFLDKPESFYCSCVETSLYSSLPITAPKFILKTGQKMLMVPKERHIFEDFWNAVGSNMEFRCLFPTSETERPLLFAQGTNSPVSAIYESHGGRIVLLPALVSESRDAFSTLMRAIRELDKRLRRSSGLTVPPVWASEFGSNYLNSVRAALGEVQDQQKKLLEQQCAIEKNIEQEELLKGLLYETGKPLEELVRASLRLMGFDVSSSDNGVTEIDVVFRSEEGAFLGEVEGRDTAQINVDKLRQLEQNVNADDYDSNERKHGVLFGNGKRLCKPLDRGEQFTENCLSHIERTSFALVRTMDLYAPTTYLRHNKDSEYARACRLAIKNAKGKIVEFPAMPPCIETKAPNNLSTGEVISTSAVPQPLSVTR